MGESAGLDYRFSYRVGDESSLNYQGRHEQRSNRILVGYYYLLQPDCQVRLVTYTADGDGFNPIVSYLPATSTRLLSAAVQRYGILCNPHELGDHTSLDVQDQQVPKTRHVIKMKKTRVKPPPQQHKKYFIMPQKR